MKTIIFDMDGVIIDSEYQWHHLKPHFLKGILSDWDKIQPELVGLSLQDECQYLQKRYNFNMGLGEYIEGYDAMAQIIYTKRCNLTEGVESFLQQLKKDNFTVALASSSPQRWIDIVLIRFNLGHFFIRTVGADEVGGRGKPAPDIYLYTARAVKVKSSECIAIEDSKNGILAAKTAGMYCIGYLNGHNKKQDLEKADVVISSFRELNPKELYKL